MRELPLILEFGAGSAELVPVVRRLGFGGAFLVYDLPPMLLLQARPQRPRRALRVRQLRAASGAADPST